MVCIIGQWSVTRLAVAGRISSRLRVEFQMKPG